MKVRMSFELMNGLLDSCQELETTGKQNLLYTGNKAKYLGGGWWFINTRVESYNSLEIADYLHFMNNKFSIK